MALRLLPLFILLTILSSAHARDSQFFSKVSRDNPDHIDHLQETQLPNDRKNVDVTKAQEGGEPTFIPQTNEHGYGLYAHETGQKYPSTDTQTPYTTTVVKTAEYEEPTFYGNKDSHDDEETPQKRSGYFYTGNDSEEKKKQKNFAEELHGLDETSLIGSGYTTGEDQKGVSSRTTTTTTDNNNGGYNGPEKTGMSDTRYLENGRYFHDISSEKKVNQQPNFYDTMRNDKYNSNDRYSGNYYYYGNKDDHSNGYDGFNGNTNSKDQGNTMPYNYQYNSNQGAYGGEGYYNKDGDNYYNKDNNNNYYNKDNNNNNNYFNNMGGYQYQHKGNNYNNQGQEEFEFDP